MTISVLPSATLLGVRVHSVTMDEAVAHLSALLTEGSGYVVTLNAAMLGRAARDEAFRRIVNSAALVTADGMGTVLVARILGVRLPQRVAGVDLVDRLCAQCARTGKGIFFLGAAPGVAEEAAQRLTRWHPGLHVVGTHPGYFSGEEEGAIVRRIRAAGTHLLLVALGSPKQELWLAQHLAESGARVGIGVGGSLDVYAGRVLMAPNWTRALGLEWVYRLIREPRRWRVAVALPRVVLMALRERLFGGKKEVSAE